MPVQLSRRHLISTLSTLGITSCATKGVKVPTPSPIRPHNLIPIKARMDRVFRVTVCSRPFRAAGPRLDVEKVGDKTVVHNYGHGGSGWSLSWGSSQMAVEKALATGEKDIAVIGAGALGLTSATLLQRAGAKVTIYAKDRPPEVRSARATGSWTPDSRVCLASKAPSGFAITWEKMARYSFQMYQSYLGMAGNPIEWVDRYFMSDQPNSRGGSDPQGLDFAHYMNRIADITPRGETLPEAVNPFPVKDVSYGTSLTFNVAAYSRQLVHDILIEGGKIEQREFHTPNDFASLPQKTIIHATGYGARALFQDESVVPVRGQISWLIPQPQVNYSVFYNDVYILARRDGTVVQRVGSGEMEGYNDPSETPDPKETEAAITTAASLFSRMR